MSCYVIFSANRQSISAKRDSSALFVTFQNFQMGNPITKLTEDCLGYVFRSCESVRDKIAFSHVCSRWRAIALDDTELWSTIPPLSVGSYSYLIPVFLERSRNAPLTVCISRPPTFTALNLGI